MLPTAATRKIDTTLLDYGVELTSLNIKRLREYASTLYGTRFKSFRSVYTTLGLDTITAQRELATWYNADITQKRDEIKKVVRQQKTQEIVERRVKREHIRQVNRLKKTEERVEIEREKANTHRLQVQRIAFVDGIRQSIANVNVGRTDKFIVSIDEGLKCYNNKMGDLLQTLLRETDQINKKYITLQVGNNHYAINDNTRLRLAKLIENDFFGVRLGTKSDEDIIVELKKVTDITVMCHDAAHKNEKHEGSFFKYFNKTNLNLSRYGILTKEQAAEPEKYYNDTCLIYALKQGGLPEQKLDELRVILRSRNVPISDLKTICEKAEIRIELSKLDKDGLKDRKNNDRFIFGREYDTIFKIGLVDSHYFIIDDEVKVTTFALENYTELQDEKDFNLIFVKCGKRGYRRDEKRCIINSFKMIRCLLDNKEQLLEKINYENSLIAATQFYRNIDDEITDLHYKIHKNTIRSVEEKDTKKPKMGGDVVFTNVFFDFETLCDEIGKHFPYLCRTESENGDKKCFVGGDCGYQMLKSLDSHTRLIAHNCTYDLRFIFRYLSQISELNRGSRMINCNAVFGKYQIQVKDSYHMIPMALRDFGKVFGLETVKEVMPYDLYNRDTVSKRFIDIDFAKRYLKKEEHDQFIHNIERWNLRGEGNTYDIIEYSSRYCEIDCSILRSGYNIFRKWMSDLTKLDINNVLTNASLSNKHLIRQGCYKAVNKLCGTPQRFIQKFVVGGRTMCANNQKYTVSGRIQDFDAVSLYPSAMFRMPGFLRGVPKVITNLSFDDLQTKDGYFVEIIVKKVGIRRAFPLMSIKNEAGVRVFTNDCVGKTLLVDKVGLEDLIRFQKVEFDIVRGYYFDEGFCDKINDVMANLFSERLRLKKEENKCETVYKVIMNSGYGGSIMKAIDTETRTFDDEKEFKTFLTRQYNWVMSYNKVSGCDKIRCKSVKRINDHFNIPHVGVSILSWSKRIMNEVMCLAEDIGVPIFYQDTDSMHLREEDIPRLQAAFAVEYGRELIGKGMGQFHSDFDFHDKNGEKRDDIKGIYAARSIFLGKKSYIDELKGVNVDTGDIETDYHIRMKGIPNSTILHTTEKLGYENPFELYEALYSGKVIKFDLTNDGAKCNFKYEKDYTVSTVKYFERTIKFQ